MEKKHYGAIDGLRAIAAIGIVMMHMGANNNYEIGGYIKLFHHLLILYFCLW